MDFEIVNINNWNINYVLEIGNKYKNNNEIVNSITNNYYLIYEQQLIFFTRQICYITIDLIKLMIKYYCYNNYDSDVVINFFNKHKNLLILNDIEYNITSNLLINSLLNPNCIKYNDDFDNEIINEVIKKKEKEILLCLNEQILKINFNIFSDYIFIKDILTNNYMCCCGKKYFLLMYYEYLIGKRKNICNCI